MRLKSVLHTRGKESSSMGNWPTATTAEAGKISCVPNYGQQGLSNHPEMHGYRAEDVRPKSVKSRRGQPGPHAPENHSTTGSRRESWPSPQARDPKDMGENVNYQKVKEKHKLTGWVMEEPNQSKGKLNPRWVETLMGLPIGWTMPSCTNPVTIELMSCDCSETESCQQQQSELGECCQIDFM